MEDYDKMLKRRCAGKHIFETRCIACGTRDKPDAQVSALEARVKELEEQVLAQKREVNSAKESK